MPGSSTGALSRSRGPPGTHPMSSGRCNARSTPCAPTRLEPLLAPALPVGRNQPTARCPDVPGQVIPQHHGLAKANPLTAQTKPRIRPLDVRRPFSQQSMEKLDTFAPILATRSEAWPRLLADAGLALAPSADTTDRDRQRGSDYHGRCP